MLKKIGIGVAVLLLVIQFIRPERNLGEAVTPQDITHAVAVPDEVMGILKTACYDCHSNYTKYPWYANVNPVGLWLQYHIDEGKGEMNFSEFATYDLKRQDHKLEELAEEVAEHEMPLSSYTLIHSEANLTDAQIKTLVDWANATRASMSGGSGEAAGEHEEESNEGH